MGIERQPKQNKKKKGGGGGAWGDFTIASNMRDSKAGRNSFKQNCTESSQAKSSVGRKKERKKEEERVNAGTEIPGV